MNPAGITYHKGSKTLELRYSPARQPPANLSAKTDVADDERLTVTAELLRVYSPSAEVRGHGDGQQVLQTGKKHVGIRAIEAVGNYAIRIVFDDGHDTGIYSWQFLRDLAENQQRYWEDYLRELRDKNASRLPAIPVGRWTPPRKTP